HDEETKASLAEDIQKWYTDTLTTIKPDLKDASRKIYNCYLPGTKDDPKGTFIRMIPFKETAYPPHFPYENVPTYRIRPDVQGCPALGEWSWRGPRTECNHVHNLEDWYVNPKAAFAKSDMIVVGAKIALSKRTPRTLEIHIKQGKLLPNGTIVVPKGESKWIAPTEQSLKRISWEQTRTFALSSKDVEPGSVISGLGFGCNLPSSCQKFHLEIFQSSVDFRTGLLGQPSKVPYSAPKT
ncbi:hypothetical protein QAD02_005684, partial [Eretmocerus hayati]